jgi:S1-C subfamily serine protease
MRARPSLQQIARELALAQAKVARLQRALARASTPGRGQPFLLHGEHRAWWASVQAKAQALEPHGIASLALGEKTRKGKQTGQPAAVALVRRKWSQRELKSLGITPLPRTLGSGAAKLKTDVVVASPFRLDARPGDRLHTPMEAGTLGCFGVDDATTRLVVFTAMHVTGLVTYPADGAPPPVFWSPAHSKLGELLRGTRVGADIAAIKPAAAGANHPLIRGFRYLTSGDLNSPVRVLGALTQVTGRITQFVPTFSPPGLPAPLVNVFFVELPVRTAPGDSGAAVIDQQGFVLGFHVGSMILGTDTQRQAISVCCTASEALSRVGCSIPYV